MVGVNGEVAEEEPPFITCYWHSNTSQRNTRSQWDTVTMSSSPQTLPVANENDTSRITKEGITKVQCMTVIQTQIQQQVEAPDSPSVPMFLSKKEHKTLHRHTRLDRELKIQDMVTWWSTVSSRLLSRRWRSTIWCVFSQRRKSRRGTLFQFEISSFLRCQTFTCRIFSIFSELPLLGQCVVMSSKQFNLKIKQRTNPRSLCLTFQPGPHTIPISTWVLELSTRIVLILNSRTGS